MPKFLTVCLCLVIAGSWADTSVEVTKTNCTLEGRKLGETYNVLSCLECTCFDNGREVCQRQFCSVYCLKEPLYQEGGLCCQSCSDMIQLSGYRSRKEGSRIHLTCTATGTGIEPANGIHWFKEGKELLNDTKNDIQKYASKDGKLILSVLSIDDADINDSGGYACSSRRNDRVGLDVKVFNSLTALERGYVTNRLPIPEFRPTKTNVTGVVRGGVVLKCLIKYVDGNRVTWWKGSKPLPPVKDKSSGSRFTKEHGSVTEQWNLVIDNLTLEDSGQYACQVEMYRRTVRQMFTLQVNTGNSSTSRDNEKQHSKYINVTGVPGGAVTLKCYVEHLGKKTVIWRKDSSLSPLTVGRTVFVGDNNIRISNGSHRGEWNLVINNLTPGHSGVYECAVPGKQKHTSIKVYSLQVNAGNSSTSRDNEKQHSKYINVTGVPGGAVTLKCYVEHLGKKTVIWRKDSSLSPLTVGRTVFVDDNNIRISNGSHRGEWNLVINNVTPGHSGVYECSVPGKQKHTPIKVYSLQMNAGNSSTSRDNEKQHSKYINVTGVPGGAVTLKCYVEHLGKKTVIWRKDSSLSPLTVGRTVFVDDNNIRISNGSHRGEWNLVINNLTPGHSGVYECSVPGKQKHTSIKVYSLQVNAGNSSTSRDNEKQHSKYINVTGVPGGAVTLKCYVEHLGKKTVIWRKDSSLSPLTVGRTVFVDDNNIRISNGSHRGEWNLVINNLTPGHSGVYECAVPGTQKHTSIKVYSLQVNEHAAATSEPSIAISGSDNVDAGGTIRLSCNISDNGVRSPHVDWFRNGSKLRPIVGSVDITQHASVTPSGTMFGSALIMVDSDVNDSGTYMCRASNMLTAQRQVTVTKRIAITGSENVTEGSTIRLSCYIFDNRTGSEHVEWFKDGIKLRPTPSESIGIYQSAPVTLDGKVSISTLVMRNADIGDSGLYVCRSSNLSIADRQVTVTKLEKRPENIVVAGVVGGNVTLVCSVRHRGTKTVIWRKAPFPSPITEGKNVYAGDPNIRISHVRHKGQWNLVIDNLTPQYSGYYQCIVNDKQRSNKTIIIGYTLQVKVGISSTSPDNEKQHSKYINVTGVPGGAVTLKCYVKHLGAKTVIWRKDSGPSPLTIGRTVFVDDNNIRISHGSHRGEWNLVINNLTPEHTGVYECSVPGKQKHTSIKVYSLLVNEYSAATSKPSIAISGSDNVEAGETIRLSCNVSDNGVRPPHFDWFKDGSKLRSFGITQHASVTPSGNMFGSALIIEDADVNNSGTYVCRASTSQTKVTAQRQVTVTKRISIAGSEYEKEGNTIRLSCYIPGNRTGSEHVDWFKDGIKQRPNPLESIDITQEAIFTRHGKVFVSTLVKRNAGIGDSGLYVCRSSNLLIEERQVTVTKRNRSESRDNAETLPKNIHVAGVVGGNVTLECSVRHGGTKTVIWRVASSPSPLTVGRHVFVGDPNFRISHEKHEGQWNLVIDNLAPHYSGMYECIVHNKQRSIQTLMKVYTLQVKESSSETQPINRSISLSGAENVEEGSAIRLSCNISDNSLRSSHVDWFKDGNKLTHNPADSITIAQQISITPGEKVVISSFVNGDADVDDSGTYVCRAPNMMTAQRQVTVIQRAFEDPSFDSVSSNVTAELGQTAVLPCSVNNLGNYLVAWMNSSAVKVAFQDMIIVDNNRLSVESPSEKEWNLHIAHVRKKDAGRYYCYVNTNPVTMSRVYLYVVVPTFCSLRDDSDKCVPLRFRTDPSKGPRFETTRTNLTAVEGQTAVLPCSVYHLGHYKVAWTKGKDLVLTFKSDRVINDDRISLERPYTKDWNLYIRHVRYDDTGDYFCKINTDPVKYAQVYLNVVAPSSQIPLVISISGAEYVEKGDSIKLSCNISGKNIPTQQFTWFKDGIKLNSEDESILIRHGVSVSPRENEVISDFENRNADIDDSGTYVCKASDKLIAQKKVIVTEPSTEPSFDNPTSNVTVYAGRTAVLPCSIKRLGDHSVAWTKGKDWVLTHGSSRIVSDRRISLQRPYTKEWNLHIRRVRYEDTGDYFCNIDTDPVKYAQVFLNVVLYPIMTVLPPSDTSIPESRAVETVLNGSLIYPSNNKTGEVSPSKETDWFRDIMETSSSAVKGFRQAISRASKQFRNQITKAFKAFKTKLSSAAKD